MHRATDVPNGIAHSADRQRVNDYDSLAEAYAAENENSLVNAFYEQPAMLALHAMTDAFTTAGFCLS